MHLKQYVSRKKLLVPRDLNKRCVMGELLQVVSHGFR